MVQNCGIPYQLTLSTLKIYITLRKILLNGAYRVNVMGLLYNDRHDILPPIWNPSHYFIGFICVLVFIYNSHIPVHTIFSCYQWSNRSLSSILSLNRCLHFSSCMFYWTIVLYMLDSWCKMHHLYSILFKSLGHISFFVYGLLFLKDKIISFYQYSMFCIIILVIWIPCVNSVVLIGIFTSYICMLFILVSVCVPVYILLCMYELYVCIYSRTIAVPANVYCWIWPDFK